MDILVGQLVLVYFGPVHIYQSLASKTLFPAYPAIKRALVKEENDLLRPIWCYVFFFRGSLPERNPKIPGVIFFHEKNYHIFKWGTPF